MLPTSNRSYTRSADGRSTTSSVSDAGSTGRSYYSTNTRRSTVSQGETANGSTATTSRSSYSTNTRRSTSGVSSSTYGSSSSSRSTYTPSRSSSRSSVSTTSPANSRRRHLTQRILAEEHHLPILPANRKLALRSRPQEVVGQVGAHIRGLRKVRGQRLTQVEVSPAEVVRLEVSVEAVVLLVAV